MKRRLSFVERKERKVTVVLNLNAQQCQAVAKGQYTIECQATAPNTPTAIICHIRCNKASDAYDTLWRDATDTRRFVTLLDIVNADNSLDDVRAQLACAPVNGKIIGRAVCYVKPQSESTRWELADFQAYEQPQATDQYGFRKAGGTFRYAQTRTPVAETFAGA